jgi:hypothetical protein
VESFAVSLGAATGVNGTKAELVGVLDGVAEESAEVVSVPAEDGDAVTVDVNDNGAAESEDDHAEGNEKADCVLVNIIGVGDKDACDRLGVTSTTEEIPDGAEKEKGTGSNEGPS